MSKKIGLALILTTVCSFAGLHTDMTGVNVHVPYRWFWADSAARVGTAVTNRDTMKVGFQRSDSTMWMLADSPAVWTWIAGKYARMDSATIPVIKGATIFRSTVKTDSVYSAKGITSGARLTAATGTITGALNADSAYVTNGMIVNGNLGIGVTPSYLVHALKSQNAATVFVLSNANNHASAHAQISAYSNTGNSLSLISNSTLNTALDASAAGILAAGKSIIYSDNINGLLINNNSNAPLYLATNNVVRMTVAADGKTTFTGTVLADSLYSTKTIAASAGINFGTTTLTKYIEGTFPMKCYQLSDSTDLTAPNAAVTCSYTIVGRHCTVTIDSNTAQLVWSGSASGTCFFGGFPAATDPATPKIVPIYYALNGTRAAGFLGWLAPGKWKLLKSDMTQESLPGASANNFTIGYLNNQVNSKARMQIAYSLD